MLTVDLVRVRRRGDKLFLLKLEGKRRQAAQGLAQRLIEIARSNVGQPRETLEESCVALSREGHDRRLGAGLVKLVMDRCEFEVEEGVDPRGLRQEVFTRAAERRRRLAPAEPFDRQAVLAQVAEQLGLTIEEVERRLYADLRGAHRLLSFRALSAEQLMEVYDQGQAQAVLLRAVRVIAEVRCTSPAALRYLFHQLKFRQLLFQIERGEQHEYRITIDGPYSLFRSITRYGLQLALVLPAIRACDHWRLKAEVLWGKERRPLVFELENQSPTEAAPRTPRPAENISRKGPAGSLLSDEATALCKKFRDRRTAWRCSPCVEILSLPGVGVCVPVLVFERDADGARVFLEVLGHWSRDAVWRRVELVERGLPFSIIFALSSRLRVSEAALDADLPGALYVFKGVMRPAAIEEKLEKLEQLEQLKH